MLKPTRGDQLLKVILRHDPRSAYIILNSLLGKKIHRQKVMGSEVTQTCLESPKVGAIDKAYMVIETTE